MAKGNPETIKNLKKLVAAVQNRIEAGTQFKIKGNVYKGKVFNCVEVSTGKATDYTYKCTDIFGDVFYFAEVNLNYYGDSVVILSSPTTDKTKTVLMSDHVRQVEVGFEYEADGVRYYSAVTYCGGQPHRYTVRLWNDSDGARFSKCSCAAAAANMLCRHVIRAAEIDSAKYGFKIYAPAFTGYRAHERRAA